jgi:RNA polymerase sigma-70 factor
MPRERPAESPRDPLDEFLSAYAPLVEWLHAKAKAARWGLTPLCFAEALRHSVEHHFRGSSGVAASRSGASAAEVAAYLESLHAEDLALACACSEGNEPAWEYFMRAYRQDLYAAARAIIGQASARADEARARELADSLYADLYGLEQRGARRRSLFDYFHGRSKLSTWLRAVLAQRFVDALRAGQRTESLEEKEDGEVLRGRAPGDTAADPDRARYVAWLQAALLEALAALGPRDRLRLAYYYVQELALAQIGRILGEHEATTSRHLDRTRRELRQRVERALREGRIRAPGTPPAGKLSEAQIRLCFEYALEEWPFDLTRALSTETSGPKREDE